MAIVTLLGSTFNTTSGTHTVTATPAVGDMIIIIGVHTGSVSGNTPTDNNSSGAYTQIQAAGNNANADRLIGFRRNSFITSAVSTIFTLAPGTTTGGGLAVFSISGVDKTVAANFAVRSFGIQDSQAAGTPAPVLSNTPFISNPIIAAIVNNTSPATMTVRTGYTEVVDVGYSTPTTGIHIMTRDAGETSATITWGSASATGFGSIAIEIQRTPTKSVNDSATISESVEITPSAPVGGGDLSIDISDTATVTESRKQEIENFANVSDAVGVTEAVVVGQQSSISKSESVTVTDTSTVIIPELLVSKSDSVNVSEAVSMLITSDITMSDSVGVLEAAALQAEVATTVTDQTTITDYPAHYSDGVDVNERVELSVSEAVNEANIDVSDSAIVAEALQRQVVNYISVPDAVDVAEATTLHIPELFKSVSDSSTVTDNPGTPAIGFSVSRTPDDYQDGKGIQVV